MNNSVNEDPYWTFRPSLRAAVAAVFILGVRWLRYLSGQVDKPQSGRRLWRACPDLPGLGAPAITRKV